MHRMILKEYFGGFRFDKQPLNELKIEGGPSSGNEPFTVVGIIQRADQKNQNGRIYPYEILKKECDRYMDLIKQKNSFGELDHTDEQIVSLKNSSHIIEDLWWDGPDKKEVWGKIKLLNTPSGEIAKSIVSDGIPLGISSRAIGSVSRDDRQDADIVQDDLMLMCWDLVGSPSTHSAFLRMQENTKSSSKVSVVENKVISGEDRIKETLRELLKKK